MTEPPPAVAPAPAPEVVAPVNAPTIGKITVAGNKKIEIDAVVTRLVSKVGSPYSAEKVRQDIESLFKAGFFYDVLVDATKDGDRIDLVYRVVEKPSVTQIIWSGNSEIDTDELKEATGLKEFEILNMAKVREATEKMQKLYEDKGFFLTRISPKIETVTEGESVKITFEIHENEKVKVKRIAFLGNKNIPDGKLKGAMTTKEGDFFSWISGSGSYKQDAFDRDVQILNYLYWNEGYVQAKVDRPEVYVTPDKKGIYITIRVEEGERYRVGNVDFAGDLLFERDDLYNSIDIDGSGWYVHETLLKDIRTLQAKYGDLGYAYANVIPRVRTRDKDREVDVTFDIDKGNKIYFGRINVVGNAKTRDKVVRREMTIREGELYNETRKRESVDAIKRLGYFDEVNFNPSTPPDNPDLMNLDVVVKERNTGSIQVGAGYSTYSEFIFNGTVNQINLFGRGQKLGVSVDLSKIQSMFNFNFTEPYLFDSKWSLGFDAFQSRRETPDYFETKKGADVRVGHPLAPYLMGYFRYKLDNTDIDLKQIQIGDTLVDGDKVLFPVDTAKGDTSSGTVTLEYDRRNDRFAPTSGMFASASLEYAGLGGDKKYTKGIETFRLYQKVVGNVVFRNNITHGFINSSTSSPPPFNELFLLGGANSLRGYDWFTVGTHRQSTVIYDQQVANSGQPRPAPGSAQDVNFQQNASRPFGGAQEFFWQSELEFPLINEAGIKGVIFYDIGAADDILESDNFKSDYGFGFRWFSPIGPLRFEWGFPAQRGPQDRPSVFQFAIGSPF